MIWVILNVFLNPTKIKIKYLFFKNQIFFTIKNHFKKFHFVIILKK